MAYAFLAYFREVQWKKGLVFLKNKLEIITVGKQVIGLKITPNQGTIVDWQQARGEGGLHDFVQTSTFKHRRILLNLEF